MLPNLEYKLIRQNRKTLSISIKNQILIIKSPLKLETRQIQNFVNEKENWIRKQIKNQKEKLAKESKLNLNFGQDEFWKVNLQSILNQKVHFWLQELQTKNQNEQKVKIKIIVKKYRTKWGSCSYFSPKNNQKQNWQISFQTQKSQYKTKIKPKNQNICSKKNNTKIQTKLTNLKLEKLTNLIYKVQNFSQDLFKNWQQNTESNQNKKLNENQINSKTHKNKTQLNKFQQNKFQNSQDFQKLNLDKLETEQISKTHFKNKLNNELNSKILPNECELKFNLRLGYVPEFVLDYVIVHELSHLWEPNHSTRFWKIVNSVLNSTNAKVWLKNEGSFYL